MMIKTVTLIPPATGLRSDPVLFAVSDALSKMFPVSENEAGPSRAGRERESDESANHHADAERNG